MIKIGKLIGVFQPLGRIPTFIEEFEKRGIKIPRTLFTGGSDQQKTAPTKQKGQVKDVYIDGTYYFLSPCRST